MYNNDTDLLFPPRVIPSLRDLRGESWRELVDGVIQMEPMAVERLAFVYMMVCLGSCTTCHADSYRALKGCTQCAQQAILRFKGNDQDLLGMYQQACQEVEQYLTIIN